MSLEGQDYRESQQNSNSFSKLNCLICLHYHNPELTLSVQNSQRKGLINHQENNHWSQTVKQSLSRIEKKGN